jgi:hypothetical protein
MRKRRAILAMGLGFCSTMATADAASAQTRAVIISYLKGLN